MNIAFISRNLHLLFIARLKIILAKVIFYSKKKITKTKNSMGYVEEYHNESSFKQLGPSNSYPIVMCYSRP